MTTAEDEPDTTRARESPRPVWRRILGSAWFQLLAAFVITGLVLSFVAKPYWVPSGSMEQTLTPGDRILVNRLAYVRSSPTTGDIIVFDADSTWGLPPAGEGDPIGAALRWLGEVTGFGPSGPHTLVKRVIAGPGQTARCCDDQGRVTVDGVALDEPYVTNDFAFESGTIDCDSATRSGRCFGPVVVPPDSYLVLGDNRSGSADSAYRCRAAEVSESCWRWAGDVVGRSVAIIWPIGRWSGL